MALESSPKGPYSLSSEGQMNKQPTQSDYQLLDSGDGAKLERFGSKVIARPSSICIWARHLSSREWSAADATFIPGKTDDSGGWTFRGRTFESWRMSYIDCDLELTLQRNGQVGLFPEHGTYLHLLPEFSGSREPPRLLNLFAFTGLASVFFAKRGWHVTHVDLSKKALSWATRNFALNHLDEKAVRVICDDAIKFLEREVRRGTTYHGIIADPPSFSRTAKGKFWKLEDMLSAVTMNCSKLLVGSKGWLAVTCHHPGVSAEMIANLLRDLKLQSQSVIPLELSISEADSPRVLPAGSFAAVT